MVRNGIKRVTSTTAESRTKPTLPTTDRGTTKMIGLRFSQIKTSEKTLFSLFNMLTTTKRLF